MAAILDNFNRSNEGPPPSLDWTNVINGLKVVSNTCRGNVGSAQNVAFWNTQFGADVEVDVLMVAKGGVNQFMEIYVRMTTQNSATMDGYSVRLDPKSGTDVISIFRYLNGTPTLLGSTISHEIVNGDVYRVRMVGDEITLLSGDGVTMTEIGTRTDATYAEAGYVGIGITHTTGVLDDFGAETISSGIVVTPAPAIAKGLTVGPTVILGSITMTPVYAIARGLTVGPTVILGSITMTPVPVVARAVVDGPVVIGGGGVNPLGEGDSPGFILFLVASSLYENLTAAGLDTGLDAPDAGNADEWGDYLFQ